jgi:hypothetical protein
MLSKDSRSFEDSPTLELEHSVGTNGLSDGKQRWDDSLAPPGESPMTGDSAAMEEALHNASQVQAHIG